MADKKYNKDNDKDHNINHKTWQDSDKTDNKSTNDNNNDNDYSENIPKLTKEEQAEQEKKRNNPDFEQELQNILPKEQIVQAKKDPKTLNALVKEHQDKMESVDSDQTNATGLPDKLKQGMESLTGFDLSAVKVHYNSSKPAEVNALAYTQGTDIHVASGQEKHVPHELAHVVQQMQGRVKPTTSVNGMSVNDNDSLEKEADTMGAKAQKDGDVTQLKTDGSKKKGKDKKGVAQMMAASKKGINQIGGTCGINSLFMAISSFDSTITLQKVFDAAAKTGSVVGEFMDVNGLSTVATDLGYSSAVVDFTDQTDMVDKLKATGSKGVLMGYSVFDVGGHAKTFPKLAADFKHLFNHWSVIEAIEDTNLKVNDPNDAGNIKDIAIADFFQANQDSGSDNGEFSFQDFKEKVGQSVVGLKANYDKQIPETDRKALSSELPSVDLNLKGKILTVSA